MPTSDEMLEAVAEDVVTGVKTTVTGDTTTTLESPTERLKAEAMIRKATASAGGWGGLVRVAKAVPPGAEPV